MNEKNPMSPGELKELEKLLGNFEHTEDPEEETSEDAEEAFREEQTEEEKPVKEQEQEERRQPAGYRRPPHRARKRRIIGLMSFLFSFLAVILTAAALANLLLAYKAGTLGVRDIKFAQISVIGTAVLAGLGLLLGLITLFLRRQKKGFAITGIVISLLMLLVSGSAIYIYQYTFGAINHQELEMDHEELHVAEPADDGELIREPETMTVIPSEEMESIESVVEDKQKELGEKIEWELLTDDDIPEEALEKMNLGPETGKSYLLPGHEQISNYLLMGIDYHESSDALMVCSVDRAHHKIKLISIPRDSYVRIPQWGTYAKLTYAYSWGGAPWTIGTVNYNYRLDITDFIAVHIEELEEIIDLVGGVDVNLDYREISHIPYGDNLHYGDCHLNGKQAVAYARIRSIDSEAARTGRQREVVMSILDSLSKRPVMEYPAFIRQCLGMSETSFSSDDLLELCTEVLQNHYTVEQYALIDRMDYWGGLLGDERYFYVVYDLNRASDQLYRIIYEDLYISGYQD